jgi:energy-coupling factor transporter ATP-binding protein EcfA2
MPSPLVALRNATLLLGSEPLLSALSAAVSDADRSCLIGRNGAGKSTLLKALAGLIELDGGERLQRLRASVTYLVQKSRLDPRLSALETTLRVAGDRLERTHKAPRLCSSPWRSPWSGASPICPAAGPGASASLGSGRGPMTSRQKRSPAPSGCATAAWRS